MSEFLDFLVTHRSELAVRLGEHIVLVGLSTLIAASIGIPFGILAAKRPFVGRFVVSLANLAQTADAKTVQIQVNGAGGNTGYYEAPAVLQDGAIVVPVVLSSAFSGMGGPPAPIDVLAQVVDRFGNVGNSLPKSFSIIGLLLLIRPIRKSVAEGLCLPFQTSMNISGVALKKQSASSDFPSLTSQASGDRVTVHFSSSPREK